MNTKFDVGQRVTYPVVHTADGNVTGIAVSKAGVTRYAIGPKWYTEDDLKPAAEEKPVTKPAESEPVKLYCVKSYEPGEWCTKGKVYEINADGAVAHDSGWVEDCFLQFMRDGGRICEAGTEWSKHLVPLVRRPAKVGEWVYLIKEPCANTSREFQCAYHKGDIVRIDFFGCFPSVKTDCAGGVSGFREDEYLVLDGYTGDPA